MIKSVIFDFDGTLADTKQVLLKVYPHVANKYGLKLLPEDELDKLKRLPVRERLKKMGIPVSKLPAIIRETRAKCEEYMDICTPYPGIPDLISNLSERGYFLSIISSNTEINIRKFLTAHNLNCFDQIITTSGLFGKHTTLAKFLKSFGFDKNQVLYVGDEMRDINACKKAGIKIIAVTWGYDDASLLEQGQPDFLVQEAVRIMGLV